MNSSIKYFLDLEMEDLRSQTKSDPFTTKFIFGHLDEYTRLRNRTFPWGPNGPIVGTCRGAIQRFDNSAETTAKVLQLAYGRILLSSEIKENIEPINIENRKYLVRQCWRYALYWLLIAVLLIGGFGLGYSNIGRVQTVPSQVASPAKQAVHTDAAQPAPTRPVSKGR